MAYTATQLKALQDMQRGDAFGNKIKLDQLARAGYKPPSGSNVTAYGGTVMVSPAKTATKPAQTGMSTQASALMNNAQQQSERAFAANRARQAKLEAGYRQMEQDLLNQVRGRYDQARSDVNRGYERTTGDIAAQMGRMGMYNTTNRGALQIEAQERTQGDLRRLAAQESGERAGIMERSRTGGLGMLERVEETYPNVWGAAQAVQQLGEGQGGSGTGTAGSYGAAASGAAGGYKDPMQYVPSQESLSRNLNSFSTSRSDRTSVFGSYSQPKTSTPSGTDAAEYVRTGGQTATQPTTSKNKRTLQEILDAQRKAQQRAPVTYGPQPAPANYGTGYYSWGTPDKKTVSELTSSYTPGLNSTMYTSPSGLPTQYPYKIQGS